MKRYSRPAFGFSENLADVGERQLAEQSERKNLFVRLTQVMEQPVDLKRLGFIRKRFFYIHAAVLNLNGYCFRFFAAPQGFEVGVFRDLAKPHFDFAVAFEASDVTKRFKESFARHIFGDRFIAAQ
jgi:hypothetical protein